MKIYKKLIVLTTLVMAVFLTGCGNTTIVSFQAETEGDMVLPSGYVIEAELALPKNTAEFQKAYGEKATDDDKKYISCQTVTDIKGYAECELLENVGGEKATWYAIRIAKFTKDGTKIDKHNIQKNINIQEEWKVKIRVSKD